MDQLIMAIAAALDIVEGELLGASTHHGKRIAVLCAAMGRHFHMDENSLSALTTCALFHDCALTEYILAERMGNNIALRLHCQYGQRNVEMLPLKADIGGFVLYHHEFADGRGAFGKKEGELPLGAELIGISDMLDVANHLQTIPLDGLASLRGQVAEKAGGQFTGRAAQAMLAILDEKMLLSLRDDAINGTVEETIPAWHADVNDTAAIRLAGLAARFIDYKSEFTKRHSIQIAERAWIMGEYYGYGESLRAQLYLAAALHDIGKLATPTHILEKQGPLSAEEFATIKEHARITYELLKNIAGFEKICDWAHKHHEKLDGAGYPFGTNAEAMDFNARLIACMDVYQAVSEPRPYHPSRSHYETMTILYDIAYKGQIDLKIVKDLDKVMLTYANADELPAPPGALR
jgi:HD-GYP domain-containing protein (c-di-GMP phosphodiesterase class II)